ncbi:MAG: hypothetical protein M9933_12360 [Chitinophagaceae bacterium]|nr:hypothetical protein [Chitinophagaceae bacterium]
MKPTLFLLLLTLTTLASSHAQDSIKEGSIKVSERLTRHIDQQITGIDHQLTRQSEKYVRSLFEQEERIRKKLVKIDSTKAAAVFAGSRATYEQLSQKLSNLNGKMDKAFSGQYLPGLDSLQGALGFLKDAKQVISQSKDIQQKLGSSLERVKQLQNKLQQADEIKRFVQQRQQQLTELLSGYTNLPKNISRHLDKYQQQAYYYGRQVKEYKEALNDPDKLVKKVLATLQTLPAFKAFMQKHSLLAQLFPTPENYGTPQALAGLQTRADVQQALQQRIGIPANNGANASPAQYLQQQMQQAQGELSKLKDKLKQLGIDDGGSSDMVIPDFKPNGQKTRSFLQRIELGSNIQTQRADNYFPTTTGIALTAGYKLNDKAVIGVGISGRLGWGRDWKHIALSAEGAGLRTYMDWKAPDLLKTNSRLMAGLWFTAGAEMNYSSTVESLAVFKNYSRWTKSALAGLTKKYGIGSPVKRGKKVQGTMQVLYDFLYKQQVPPTPAIVWRVGWGL